MIRLYPIISYFISLCNLRKFFRKISFIHILGSFYGIKHVGIISIGSFIFNFFYLFSLYLLSLLSLSSFYNLLSFLNLFNIWPIVLLILSFLIIILQCSMKSIRLLIVSTSDLFALFQLMIACPIPNRLLIIAILSIRVVHLGRVFSYILSAMVWA